MKKQLQVLWVDDEIDLLQAFIIFLKEKNVHVTTATNGDDAVVLFINNRFDLVILDEMMPGMDGLATLAEINKINSEIPVIMLTKSEEEGLMETAISKQINEYLIKPVNPNQILMAIKRIFHTDEIRLNRIGQEYSQFSAMLSRKLFSEPDFREWTEIYKDICHWDIVLDQIKDENLKHAHFLEKRNCNTEFCNYIEDHYKKWLNSNDRPNLSYDVVSQYVIPQLEDNKTVYFFGLCFYKLNNPVLLFFWRNNRKYTEKLIRIKPQAAVYDTGGVSFKFTFEKRSRKKITEIFGIVSGQAPVNAICRACNSIIRRNTKAAVPCQHDIYHQITCCYFFVVFESFCI